MVHYRTVAGSSPRASGGYPAAVSNPYSIQDEQTPMIGSTEEKGYGVHGPGKRDDEGCIGFGLSVFNLMNAILGSGILGLAYAIKVCGFVPFFIFLAGFASLAIYTIHLLLKLCTLVDVTSYEQLGQVAFGKWGKAAACIAIIVQNIGGMCSYLIIDGDLLPEIMSFFLALEPTAPSIWMNRKLLMGCIILAIVLPLAMAKKIGFLAYSSSLSVLFSASFAIVVVIVFPMTPCTDPSYCWTDTAKISVETLFVLPIIAFSFQCHTTLLPVFHELKGRSKTRMQWIGNVSVSLSAFLYILAALFGYLTFQQHVQSDLLKVYSTFGSSALLILLTRIAIAGSVTLTVPLLCFPARKAASYLIWNNDNFTWKRHVSLTLFFVSLISVIAMYVPDVKVVFALAGATSSTALILVLPGLFFIRIMPGKLFSREKIIPLIVVCLGVALGVGGVTAVTFDLVTT